MAYRSHPRTRIQLQSTPSPTACVVQEKQQEPGTPLGSSTSESSQASLVSQMSLLSAAVVSCSVSDCSSRSSPLQTEAKESSTEAAQTFQPENDGFSNSNRENEKNVNAPFDPRGGFFPHKIVSIRGAFVVLRGNNFHVSSSEKKLPATEEILKRRREWLVEKRNYERKAVLMRKNKRPFFQYRNSNDRCEHFSEHYIPETLPQDEAELFADARETDTGRLIDDCMEQAVQCTFLTQTSSQTPIQTSIQTQTSSQTPIQTPIQTQAPIQTSVQTLRQTSIQTLRQMQSDVGGRHPPPPVSTVTELRLPRKMTENLYQMKIEDLLPVQRHVIPLVRGGFDVVATSPTGSGKTAAFLVPIIEDIFIRKGEDVLERKKGTQALVICPTRELAKQTTDSALRIAFGCDVTSFAVYGAIDSQFLRRGLRAGPDIVVGTPGRLWDLIENKLISLQNVRFVVVDEVDGMMAGRSFPEVQEILQHCTFPSVSQRQTLFFSATISKDLLPFLTRHQAASFSVRVGSGLTLGISHKFERTKGHHEKIDKLRLYLDDAVKEEKSVIVFCGSNETVDRLHENLRGFTFLLNYGKISQTERANALKRFASKEVSIMIASDLCSRGLDIEGVDMIINFNMPRSADAYVHRIGRSGRKGHEGVAVTFYDASFRFDCLCLEETVALLRLNGVLLDTWIDQEINQIRHNRINEGRCQLVTSLEGSLVTSLEGSEAEDLADLGIFLSSSVLVPVVASDWLRSW